MDRLIMGPPGPGAGDCQDISAGPRVSRGPALGEEEGQPRRRDPADGRVALDGP